MTDDFYTFLDNLPEDDRIRRLVIKGLVGRKRHIDMLHRAPLKTVLDHCPCGDELEHDQLRGVT